MAWICREISLHIMGSTEKERFDKKKTRNVQDLLKNCQQEWEISQQNK